MLRDIISVFFTKILVLIISLVTMVIVSRSLGAEGRGSLALILVVPQLLIALFEGGMRQAAIVFLGKKKYRKALVVAAVGVYAIIAGVVGYFVASWIMVINYQQFDLLIVFVAALILPFTLVYNSIQGILLGDEKIAAFNKVQWHPKVFYLLILLILLFYDKLSIFTVVTATVCAAIYSALQATWFIKENRGIIEFELSVLKRMLSLGVSYAFALFLIQANYKIDIILLGILSSKSEVGEYAVSVQIAELLWQLPAAVVIVMMSKTANSGGTLIIDSICKSSRVTLLITVFSALILMLFVHLFSQPILGVEYKKTFSIIASLLFGVVFMTVFKSLNAYYAGKGNPYVAMKVMFIATLSNILANFVLIPIYGAVGAGFASTFSYIIASISISFIFCRDNNIHFSKVYIVTREDMKFRKGSL